MNYSGIIFALKDNDNGIKKSEKKNKTEDVKNETI